jgi:SNF2 family DNA or RNA helicase
MSIEQIRELRKKENFTLKPTPYLKSTYIDEYGDEKPIEIRNYQKIGIYSALVTPRMILGDSTGLGKTIQVLSAIGYVWLKEPDYIPIVVTKKSALFQWESETRKFMQNMRAVTVTGAPYERDIIYDKFFNCRREDDKALLILTYDNVLKDGQTNVVKDRSVKPPKELKKILKEARATVKEKKAKLSEQKAPFNTYMQSRSESIRLHMVDLLKPRDESMIPVAPGDWTKHDQDVYELIIRLRKDIRDAEVAKNHLDDQAAPPVVSKGLIGYMRELLLKDPQSKFMVIFDEIHTLKNYRGKIHEVAATVAQMSQRRVGLTATPVKNRLMEFFSIFKVIEPDLFPKVSHFHRDFCKVKMQQIGKGRWTPIVIGHSKEQLDSFNQHTEPFYLARQKHEVAKELPELITRELICELSDEQEELYDLAELGALNKSEEDLENTAELLSSLVLLQQACNAPQLIADDEGNPFDGASSKIDAILELLEDDLVETKTIIFSRFEKMISLLEKRLKEKKIQCTRITGAESKASTREANKNKFQDMNSGCNVILITAAGSESINLQSAEHIICIDSPWSWGDYIQLVGRAIRIGSKNAAVVVTHLMAMRQNGKQTLDHHVIKILRGKKRLADKVAGVSLKDGLRFVEAEAAMDLFIMLSDSVSAADRLSLAERVKRITTKKTIHSMSSKKVKKAPEPDPTTSAAPEFDFSDI